MNPQALRVRPVRRYRRPNYPSWQAPNPLHHPETVPYPLRRRAARVLAFSGVVSTLSWGCASPTSNHIAGRMTRPTEQKQDSVALPRAATGPDSRSNPFSFPASGLPYHAPMFGTGQPERLHDKEIRPLMQQAFAAQGYALQPDFLFTSGSFSLLLSGFDPAHRTGYVFIPSNRLDRDGVQYGWREAEERPLSECYFEKVLDYSRRKKSPFLHPSPFLKKQLAAARKEPDPVRRDNRIREIAREDLLRSQLEQHNPDWLKQRIESALATTEPALREAALTRCASMIDVLRTENLGQDDLQPVMERVVQELDRAGRFPLAPAAVQDVLRIARYYYHLDPAHFDYTPGIVSDTLRQGIQGKQNAIRQGLGATGAELDRQLRLLAAEADAFLVSLPDIRMLDSLAAQGIAFIAPVSQYSRLCSYYWEKEPPSGFREGIAAALESGDTATARHIEDMLHASKRFRLEELQQSVGQYIQWARSQGRF